MTDDQYGDWTTDKENDTTIKHQIQMPFVNYSDMVHNFIDDVYKFMDDNEDMELNDYSSILEKNGIKWDYDSMKYANVSSVDAKCLMALIIAAVRAERFCEGALLDFFNSGCIIKWINRLKEIDDN